MSVEKFRGVSLNRKNRLIKCREVTWHRHLGFAHPREVFSQRDSRRSCRRDLRAQPSGDPAPSAADV
ncbi:MAG: hypothetical protein H7A44_12020 [Opitutaceae bacterium]|nr:hypothetical protein [Opitutaceae bacterium]